MKSDRRKKTANIVSVLLLTVLLIIAAYAAGNMDLPDNTGGSGDVLSDNITISPSVASEPDLTVSPSPASESPVAPATASPAQMPAEHPGEADEDVPETLEDLEKYLEEYIAGQEGRYGLYYINLATGEEFGINDREKYIAASTTKLPMNLLLYRKIAAGEISFDDKLVYLEEDFEPGTGIIQDSPYGTEYTVRETARLSIVYSDNCAINMIIRLLGIENIRQYMLDIGGTIYYGSDHRSCPYDLAVYARELYRFYRENPEIAGILMDDLMNTMWNDRINKLLPEDVKVAHKIGNFEGVYNDVGIVFAKEPYVLAVMSEDVDQSVASDVIAQMSKKIYDYIVTSSEARGN